MLFGARAHSFRNVQRPLKSYFKDYLLCSKRYAVLVNPASSVDPVLGTTAPQPPAVKRFTDGDKVDTLSYRQDFEFFANMLNSSSSKVSLEGRRAQVERIKSSATGSRPGMVLPEPSRALADRLNKAINFWDEHPSMFHNSNASKESDLGNKSTLKEIVGIKRDLILVARHLQRDSKLKPTSMRQIQQEMNTKVDAQLSTTLPYEPMPKSERKVNLTGALSTPEEIHQAHDDGVLLICYVDCSVPENESVSFCSGFAVQGGSSMGPEDSPGRGALVITCAHEMEAAIPTLQNPDKGLILAMTRKGYIFPVQRLLSYMPNADLTLVQLSEDAVHIDPVSKSVCQDLEPQLVTLPVSPYPAVVNTELSVCSFGGWLPSSADQASGTISRFLHDDAVRNRWARATLVGYRDPIGRQAETGTYDELAQLDFILKFDSPDTPASIKDAVKVSPSAFPLPGSSGGPVVDVNTGSVVGVVRGQKSSKLGDSRGDAVPAEKVFECLGKRR